jgi:hypothetical protein
MSAFGTWWARVTSVVGAATFALLVPATAWASTGPGVLAIEAARRRPRFGGGIFAAVCCLVVVGILVVVLLLVLRGRRGGRR